MLKAKKFELVELQIAASSTGTRFNFPDLPKLRYKALMALEAFTVNDIAVSPSNVAVVSLADFKQSYLVLYADDREDLYRIPLIALHRIQNASNDPFVRAHWLAAGQKITWEKSYIQTASTVAATAFSYLFGVYYEG